MGGFSIWHLVILLVIVLVLFGTSRLRGIGSDLGDAIKSFRSAVKDEEEGSAKKEAIGHTIEAEVKRPEQDAVKRS